MPAPKNPPLGWLWLWEPNAVGCWKVLVWCRRPCCQLLAGWRLGRPGRKPAAGRSAAATIHHALNREFEIFDREADKKFKPTNGRGSGEDCNRAVLGFYLLNVGSNRRYLAKLQKLHLVQTPYKHRNTRHKTKATTTHRHITNTHDQHKPDLSLSVSYHIFADRINNK